MTQFFARPRTLTVREIVALTGAAPRQGADLDRVIAGIGSIERARPSDLVFVDATKAAEQFAATRAGVCLVSERFAVRAPKMVTVLLSAEPFRDFVTVARELY